MLKQVNWFQQPHERFLKAHYFFCKMKRQSYFSANWHYIKIMNTLLLSPKKMILKQMQTMNILSSTGTMTSELSTTKCEEHSSLQGRLNCAENFLWRVCSLCKPRTFSIHFVRLMYIQRSTNTQHLVSWISDFTKTEFHEIFWNFCSYWTYCRSQKFLPLRSPWHYE